MHKGHLNHPPALEIIFQTYTPREDRTSLHQTGRGVRGFLFPFCFGACVEIFLYCCFTILKNCWQRLGLFLTVQGTDLTLNRQRQPLLLNRKASFELTSLPHFYFLFSKRSQRPYHLPGSLLSKDFPWTSPWISVTCLFASWTFIRAPHGVWDPLLDSSVCAAHIVPCT